MPADAKGMLKTAIRDDNPVMFLEHLWLYNTKGVVPEGEHTVPFGEADVKRVAAMSPSSRTRGWSSLRCKLPRS